MVSICPDLGPLYPVRLNISVSLTCSTTDHISAAGPWLKFKGHLSNISENTCAYHFLAPRHSRQTDIDLLCGPFAVITAVNDEGGEVNVAFDAEGKDTIPNVMKKQKAAGQPWMLVVDQNCKRHGRP